MDKYITYDANNCIKSLGECIVYLSSINLIDKLIRDKQR